MRDHRGFSLVEVIVALVILAGLSLLTAESMRSAISQRTLVASELDRDAKLADALRIIRNDVAAAFNHRDILLTMINQLNEKPTPAPGSPPNPAAPIPPPPLPFGGSSSGQVSARPTPKPVTGFVGEAEAMYFTTLSNVRLIRDARESDQAKIGYFLKDCTKTKSQAGRGPKNQSTQCLYRSISPELDDDVTATGPESVLLEDVVEFKLRYFDSESEEPLDSWNSTGEGMSNTKGRFPLAVEVTLTTHDRNDPKDKPATATILAPIRFPNNPPKKPGTAAQ